MNMSGQGPLLFFFIAATFLSNTPSQPTPKLPGGCRYTGAGRRHPTEFCRADAGGVGASLTRLGRRLRRRQSHRRLPGPTRNQLQHAGPSYPLSPGHVPVHSCSARATQCSWALWEGEQSLVFEPASSPNPPSHARSLLTPSTGLRYRRARESAATITTTAGAAVARPAIQAVFRGARSTNAASVRAFGRTLLA